MRISSAIWMNFPFWKEGEEEDGLTDCFIIKRVGRRDLCRVLRNAHTVCCAPLILSEGDLINICTETDGRTDGRRRRMWKCRDADWHSRSVRVVMETVDFHQCEMRGEMNRANDISLFWWLGAITNHRLFTHCPTKHEGWFKKKTASNNNKRKTWKEKQDWWWPSLDLDPFGRVPHRKEDSQVSAHCDGRRPVWKSGIRPSNFQTTSVSVSVWQ